MSRSQNEAPTNSAIQDYRKDTQHDIKRWRVYIAGHREDEQIRYKLIRSFVIN
jgi:hypothetical protein